MSFNDSRLVTSRKDRRCYMCGRVINAGERHEYTAGVYEGDFYATRQHLRCKEFAEESGYDFELHDQCTFREMLDEQPACVAELERDLKWNQGIATNAASGLTKERQRNAESKEVQS